MKYKKIFLVGIGLSRFLAKKMCKDSQKSADFKLKAASLMNKIKHTKHKWYEKLDRYPD